MDSDYGSEYYFSPTEQIVVGKWIFITEKLIETDPPRLEHILNNLRE